MTALLIRRDENSIESPLYDNITSMRADEGLDDYVICDTIVSHVSCIRVQNSDQLCGIIDLNLRIHAKSSSTVGR